MVARIVFLAALGAGLLVAGCSSGDETAAAAGGAAGAGGGSGGVTGGAAGASGATGGASGANGGAGGVTGGAGGAGGSDGGSGPKCGPVPARYTLLTGADDGLVIDHTTNLTWMREQYTGISDTHLEAFVGQEAKTYCTGRGMRLPLKDEALAISGVSYASCAFGEWVTWTSTVGTQGSDYWYTVDYKGNSYEQFNNNYPTPVLCVRP
jgi:hypothetical protein